MSNPVYPSANSYSQAIQFVKSEMEFSYKNIAYNKFRHAQGFLLYIEIYLGSRQPNNYITKEDLIKKLKILAVREDIDNAIKEA